MKTVKTTHRIRANINIYNTHKLIQRWQKENNTTKNKTQERNQLHQLKGNISYTTKEEEKQLQAIVCERKKIVLHI